MPLIPLFKVLMTEAAISRAAEVLRSGYIGQGKVVDVFEAELGCWLGDVLTLNSCTSALDLSLYLAGVRQGDEVVTTAQTCTATNGSIVNRGAIPVWADVHPETGLLDPASVEKLIGPRTRAIMAVDWGGSPCDYDRLRSFGLPVIEDAAHAFLAPTGGTYVCWSTQAIKHLTTVDGGLLQATAFQMERARLLRWYGLDRRSGEAAYRCAQNIQEVGWKYHMNDVAAAIGIGNLPEAILAVGKHRANAAWYGSALSGLSHVTLPHPNPHSSWWLYTLLVDDRASFMAWMTERDIATSPVHARNDHHHAFRTMGLSLLPTPGVDYFSSHEVAIPVGWWLSEEDRNRVAEAVIAWSKR